MQDDGIFAGKAPLKRSHMGLRLVYLATVPLGIIALSAFIAAGISVPNAPAVLLLAVVYSAYGGGLVIGLANAGMHVLYAATFFSEPHYYFSYDSQSFARVIVFVVVAPTTAALVGLLRRQADQYKQLNEDARLKAESAVQEYAKREQLFIAAVESSNDAIVTKTLEGVITGWNEAAEHLFGFTAQEAIGNRIDIIVPEELRDEVRAILTEIKCGKKVDNHETVRINKNGQRIDVSLSIWPVKSQSGVIIGAAKVARDIRARKKAQESLRESEQMSRAIIDTALDAFLQLDKSGTVIGWSPKAEEMFGWSGQEIVGQKLRDFVIPPENRDTYSERIALVLRDAENGIFGRRYEASSLRRGGRLINTELSLTALWRRDGYVINVFIRDITEKVAAEEKLKQALKMEAVGQLTGGVAHDFNNMLTVITGTIDILVDAVADKPQLAAIAKLISEAADRGAELTGHLLAFARKQPLQPREIDVNALLVESRKLLCPTLGEHIEIETVLNSDVWPALVDPNQFSSALLNLAINARDAMPNGGKLTLDTSNVVLDESYAKINGDVQPGEYVLIAVSDTGDGIPEAIRDKIFEPFFTTKEVGKGTGLGLSMVYGFVKQSGGHIKVYSEEGHGTTFKIYLPRAVTQAYPIAVTSSDSQIEGGTETILVVEDDSFVRTSAITQLHSLGYKTLAAPNAAEALAIADGGAQFDLLFTDVIMPGKMNGRQLAEELAKRRSSLKVLFTSGYTEDAVIHHGRLDPGVLLLAKPYRKLELARMLRRALVAANALPARGAVPSIGSTMSASADHNSEMLCIRSAFVLDDDPQIGAIVCKVLETSGVVSRQFTNSGPFLSELLESPPDIIVLDLSLGQSDAIEVIRHLEVNKYRGKLLLISGRDETTLNEITEIGEKRGLAMLPPLKKPFRPADIKQRLSSNTTGTEHCKVQESPDDALAHQVVVPLIEALRNNWLELWYQPKVDLKSFSVYGAEGLVRARHRSMASSSQLGFCRRLAIQRIGR